jgi:hypothetical protein
MERAFEVQKGDIAGTIVLIEMSVGMTEWKKQGASILKTCRMLGKYAFAAKKAGALALLAPVQDPDGFGHHHAVEIIKIDLPILFVGKNLSDNIFTHIRSRKMPARASIQASGDSSAPASAPREAAQKRANNVKSHVKDNKEQGYVFKTYSFIVAGIAEIAALIPSQLEYGLEAKLSGMDSNHGGMWTIGQYSEATEIWQSYISSYNKSQFEEEIKGFKQFIQKRLEGPYAADPFFLLFLDIATEGFDEYQLPARERQRMISEYVCKFAFNEVSNAAFRQMETLGGDCSAALSQRMYHHLGTLWSLALPVFACKLTLVILHADANLTEGDKAGVLQVLLQQQERTTLLRILLDNWHLQEFSKFYSFSVLCNSLIRLSGDICEAFDALHKLSEVVDDFSLETGHLQGLQKKCSNAKGGSVTVDVLSRAFKFLAMVGAEQVKGFESLARALVKLVPYSSNRGWKEAIKLYTTSEEIIHKFITDQVEKELSGSVAGNTAYSRNYAETAKRSCPDPGDVSHLYQSNVGQTIDIGSFCRYLRQEQNISHTNLRVRGCLNLMQALLGHSDVRIVEKAIHDWFEHWHQDSWGSEEYLAQLSDLLTEISRQPELFENQQNLKQSVTRVVFSRDLKFRDVLLDKRQYARLRCCALGKKESLHSLMLESLATVLAPRQFSVSGVLLVVDRALEHCPTYSKTRCNDDAKLFLASMIFGQCCNLEWPRHFADVLELCCAPAFQNFHKVLPLDFVDLLVRTVFVLISHS